MKLLIQFSIAFALFQMYGQEFKNQSVVGSVTSMNDIFSKKLVAKSSDDFTGTTYLYPNWENNAVLYSEGRKYILDDINLDLSFNEFSTQRGKDSLFIYDKSKLDSLRINNKLFKKFDNELFYDVLFEGNKSVLLKKYEVKIIEGMFNPTDGTREKDRYKVFDFYYIKENNDFRKIKLNKRSVFDLINDEDLVKVKKFVKENKLSYTSEKDVIGILSYYEEI